jgi:hypothetical protein
VIKLVRAENPDLAGFLKLAYRMPLKYGERIARILSDEENQTIALAWQKAVERGDE